MRTYSTYIKMGQLYVAKRTLAVIDLTLKKSHIVPAKERVLACEVMFEIDDKEKEVIGAYVVLTKSGCSMMVASKDEFSQDLQEYDEWLKETEEEKAMYARLLESLRNAESSSKTT